MQHVVRQDAFLPSHRLPLCLSHDLQAILEQSWNNLETGPRSILSLSLSRRGHSRGNINAKFSVILVIEFAPRESDMNQTRGSINNEKRRETCLSVDVKNV